MAGLLAGCATYVAPFNPPPPYAVLPVDESMSCNGIAASFRYAARRAARLEYWLSVGPLAGYGYERYPLDAPKQLIDERRRMDALTDLQRYKGCTVMEPGPAVEVEADRQVRTLVHPALLHQRTSAVSMVEPGPFQPPKKSSVAIDEAVIIAAYSAMKNIANFIDEYSVWNPPTSSVSASGRSNGTRLVSANPETKYRNSEIGWKNRVQSSFVCPSTKSAGT